MKKQICIYCSSSAKTPSTYIESAKKMVDIIFENECSIIYGGGAVGLMGAVADQMILRGGEITGVIPTFMKDVEWNHPGVTDMIEVDNMRIRKHRFLQDADVILTLPGGCGTLEELLEVVTLKRLSQFRKPIIIFNQDGFYDGLLMQFQRCIDDQCMSEKHGEIWTVIEHPEQLFPAIERSTSWEQYSIKEASV